MGEFTYEHLFDAVRRERSREELQDVEEGFFADAKEYLQGLAGRVRATDVLSTDGETARTQLANSKKLLRELFDRREKKILLLALNKARTGSSIIDTSSLLPSEKDVFERLVKELLVARSTLTAVLGADRLTPMKSSENAETPEKREELSKQEEPSPEASTEPEKPSPPEAVVPGVPIRITASIPKFLGANKQTFGPYEEGDEIELPERIASILVKKGRAEHA